MGTLRKTFTIDAALNQRVSDYASKREISDSRAIASLIEAGMEATQYDGASVASELASLRSALQKMAGSLSDVEAGMQHLAVMNEHLEEFTEAVGFQDQRQEWLDRRALSLFAEISVVTRYLLKKSNPELYDQLPNAAKRIVAWYDDLPPDERIAPPAPSPEVAS